MRNHLVATIIFKGKYQECGDTGGNWCSRHAPACAHVYRGISMCVHMYVCTGTHENDSVHMLTHTCAHMYMGMTARLSASTQFLDEIRTHEGFAHLRMVKPENCKARR